MGLSFAELELLLKWWEAYPIKDRAGRRIVSVIKDEMRERDKQQARYEKTK